VVPAPARAGPSAERPETACPRARAALGGAGLAFLAPITTGTHVATVAALATGSDTWRVLRWMAIGLVVWAVAITVATAAGIDVFT
jgi:hypothetical protein